MKFVDETDIYVTSTCSNVRDQSCAWLNSQSKETASNVNLNHFENTTFDEVKDASSDKEIDQFAKNSVINPAQQLAVLDVDADGTSDSKEIGPNSGVLDNK